MFNIGPWELALILLVALIVVGPGKLPEIAKSIGKGLNEFKKVTSGYKKDLQDAMDEVQAPVKQLVEDSQIMINKETEIASAPLEKKEEVIKADRASAPEKEQ
jgi:sec-independent protein translocase protein TatA